MTATRLVAIILGLLAAPVPTYAADPPAKELFGAATAPTRGDDAAVIGSYAKGASPAAIALPIDGPAWQAMRLSRNRVWGPSGIGGLHRAAGHRRARRRLAGPSRRRHGTAAGRPDAHRPRLAPDRARRRPLADPDAGPAAQRRGTGNDFGRLHAPARRTNRGRDTVHRCPHRLDQARVTRSAGRADLRPPGIKQALCARATGDRAWLNKVRPWWGHDAHFHVRLACPPGERLCRDQEAPPPGDGCGDDLAWWLTDEPWKPKPPRTAYATIATGRPAGRMHRSAQSTLNRYSRMITGIGIPMTQSRMPRMIIVPGLMDGPRRRNVAAGPVVPA